MKKMILFITVIIIAFIAALGVFAYGELGTAPTAEEQEKFSKLPYYKDGKFQNPQEPAKPLQTPYEDKMVFWKLLLSDEHAPQKPLPIVSLNKSDFSAIPADNAIYWLGHASTLVELNGKRLGIDLVFGNASPIPYTVRRYQKSPVERSELPKLDYIILTHNHYDHLEKQTVKNLPEGHFIVPLGVKTALTGWGIAPERITEIGWNETLKLDGLKITAVKGIHFSGRSLTDGNKTLWNSYVLQTPEHTVFWGGDSGYGAHYKEISDKYGPFDWAALEIDAWNGGWPGIHMFPEQMLQAAEDLRAKYVLPIHWGVYSLGNHDWNKSINRIYENARNKPYQLMTPKMGEKLIPGETKTSAWWK